MFTACEFAFVPYFHQLWSGFTAQFCLSFMWPCDLHKSTSCSMRCILFCITKFESDMIIALVQGDKIGKVHWSKTVNEANCRCVAGKLSEKQQRTGWWGLLLRWSTKPSARRGQRPRGTTDITAIEIINSQAFTITSLAIHNYRSQFFLYLTLTVTQFH